MIPFIVTFELVLHELLAADDSPFLCSFVSSFLVERLVINEDIRDAVDLWCNSQNLAILRYGHISFWDTSRMTNMAALFASKKEFCEDIEQWDVSNVQIMSFMFSHAEKFNRPLNRWNVSKVTHMVGMFQYAVSFNQPLKKWKPQRLVNADQLFFCAFAFDRSLASWKVPNLETAKKTIGLAKLSYRKDWKRRIPWLL